MALFGEKYGERVRMVEIPGVSLELCGGAHLARTSQAGLFKIISETGVAAGVRRIEAVTGAGARSYLAEIESSIEHVAALLRTSRRDIVGAVEKLTAQRAELEKQVRQLKSGAAAAPVELREAEVAGARLVYGIVPSADAATLAVQADRTLQRYTDGTAVVLGAAFEGKALFVTKLAPDLVRLGWHAGTVVRDVAGLAGGGGGGRPDFGQAGGGDPAKLAEAIDAIPGTVERHMASRTRS
jgi:alanyl-tRNA synthetase